MSVYNRQTAKCRIWLAADLSWDWTIYCAASNLCRQTTKGGIPNRTCWRVWWRNCLQGVNSRNGSMCPKGLLIGGEQRGLNWVSSGHIHEPCHGSIPKRWVRQSNREDSENQGSDHRAKENEGHTNLRSQLFTKNLLWVVLGEWIQGDRVAAKRHQKNILGTTQGTTKMVQHLLNNSPWKHNRHELPRILGIRGGCI